MSGSENRFKNFLKRFFPVSIHRFNQEISGIRDTMQTILKQQEQITKTVAKRDDLLIPTLEEMQGALAALESSLLSLKTESDIARRSIEESLERQDLLKKSVESISHQLFDLSGQIKGQESSIKKLNGIEGLIRSRCDRLERCINHCLPRAELSFEVALAEHCDLNCAGCDHFSPLAEPEFADFEETSRDFERLSVLFHGLVREVHLLGGEPLLHPDLVKFFKIARENFPDAVIDITTNGIKLLTQPEEFWLACKEYNIVIRPTKYPIPLKFEEIEQLAADYGVDFHYINNSGVIKTTHLYRLDVEGLQDGNRSFLLCSRANRCIYLQHGKLYTCTIAPTVRHFNKHFGTNLKELPEDSIDIYQATSAQEIMQFLARPIPFCRYCMTDKTRWDQPWHQSKCDIEEWT